MHMKAGIHISSFNFGSEEKIAPVLSRIAKAADENGFATITVMDHYFQIFDKPHTDPMMEAYTTLSFLAAITKRVKLGTLVTGVVYRQPALLVKEVTALDVLSGGRAFLGIGAAWNEEECLALGFPFPSTKERFERLEETLQIALCMWGKEAKPYSGKYYTLQNPHNNPQPVTKPHPQILIGGGGEQKTLKFVAKYADACNLFGGMDDQMLQRKLDILRQHCEEIGREYKSIRKTIMHMVIGSNKEIIARSEKLAKMGFDEIFFIIPDMEKNGVVAKFGKEIVSTLADI